MIEYYYEEPVNDSVAEGYSARMTLDKFIAEYQEVNRGLLFVFDALDKALSEATITLDTVKAINETNIVYTNHLLEDDAYRLGIGNLKYCVLQSTMSEAYQRSLNYFNHNSPDEANAQKTKLVVEILRLFKSKERKFLIQLVNSLFRITYDLNIDLSTITVEDNFKLHFSINCLNNIAIQFNDNLKLQKITYARRLVECEIFMATSGIYDYDNASYIEYTDRCRKAIAAIDEFVANVGDKLDTLTEEEKVQIEADYRAEYVIEQKDDRKSNSEYTTARQVLAMYYLFNEFKDNLNQVDRTSKSEFIEFLTGKNKSKIYKQLSNPLEGLEKTNNKNAIKDMKYVKSLFDSLNLKRISDQIERDMKI